MSQTLRVLVLLEGIGLAGLPLISRALGRLPGAGLGLSKVFGLLLVSWIVWMAGSLGIPNGLGLAIGGALAVVALAVAAALRGRRRPAAPDPFRRRLWLSAEVLFAVCFLVAAFVGSYSPDVSQTEQPMDMMLVNSTLTSDSFPPHDPWLSGTDVNYYYLGQLMMGLLIRLTGVEPTVGYNLAFAALFALTATAAFTLAASLAEAARRQGMAIRRPRLAGGLCVVLLLLMGNLRGGWNGLHADKLAAFDWFGQSRVIPNTINEFPFFSFTVGDLHAHVIALPLTLLALAFVVQVGLHGPPRVLRRAGMWETFCAALAIGWLYTVNSWSWPVTAGLLALTAVVWLSSAGSKGARRRATAWTVGVIALGVLLIAPFVATFEPNVNSDGLLDTVALTRAGQREPFGLFLRHHLVMEGALLWLLLAPLAGRLAAQRHPLRLVVFSAGTLAVAMPLLAGANLAGAGLVAALVAAATAAALRRQAGTAERVLWVLAAVGLACLLASEIAIVKDEFIDGPYARMNTVFKMGYQAWVLLAVFGAVALAGAKAWLPAIPRFAWVAVAAGLVAVSLGFTVAGTVGRKTGFSDGPRLDGRRWLARTAPGDVAAIDWMRSHVPHEAVVLEAVGDDYSAFGNARVSIYTGLQTVLGWQGHELQWSHDIGSRRAEVETMYTSPRRPEVLGLLRRYGVGYAMIGPLERTTYEVSSTLSQLGERVFERHGTAVYRFAPGPRTAPPAAAPPVLVA